MCRLEIYLAAGGSQPTVVEYRINGGATRVATVTGSALGNVSVASALQLLCYATGYQFTSYVQRISAWHNGVKPYWVL